MIKRFMSIILSAMAALVLQFMPVSGAWAGVCALSNSSAINITSSGQIQLTPSTSAPTTTAVLYRFALSTSGITFNCTGSTQWQSAFSRAYTSTPEDHIYRTEIQGIGIRVKWPASYSDAYHVPGVSTPCIGACIIPSGFVIIEFLHIGVVNEGEQTIPAGELFTAYFLNDNGSPVFLTVSLGADVIITPRTCAIYPSANHIDLGIHDKASLLSSGAGSLVDFYLHVSCPQSSTIGLSFESLNSVFASSNGDIGASASSVPGLSTRVTINRLGVSYTAITLGTNNSFFNVLERNIPMQAQLYVKDSALFQSSGGAGTVNSGLLYTMTIR